MQAFGGANSDPDSWDVKGDFLAYGCGSCVIVQNMKTYATENYLPLKFGVITCVKFTKNGLAVIGTSDGLVFLIDPTKHLTLNEDFSPISTYKCKSSITHIAVSSAHIILSTALNGIHLLTFDENCEKFFEEERFAGKMPNIRCISLAVHECYNSFIVAYSKPDGCVIILAPETGEEVTLQGSAWCQSVKFMQDGEKSIRMVTAAQDKLIRVWQISTVEKKEKEVEMSVSELHSINLPEQVLSVELLANLAGHQDWVNCVDFFGTTIASASYDGQVLLWKEDKNDDGTPIVGSYDIAMRLGSTAVNDDQSGMTCCKLLNETDIVASSRNGGFSYWKNGVSQRCFAGHTDIVTSCCWASEGFFLTVGMDKVARCYGKYTKEMHNDVEASDLYVELARPLIHGHAIHDVAQVDIDKFGFCSDEKEIRVLQPTSNFAKLVGGQLGKLDLPFASMVPPLNLSNKILKTEESVAKEFDPLTANDFIFKGIPPAHSMWLTRWPEVDAIWGHFRELTKIAVASKWIGSGDDRGAVVVRDAEKRRFNSGSTVGDESVNKVAVTALAVPKDELSLLSVCKNGIVRVFSAENGTVIVKVNVGNDALGCAWDESGNYFVVAASDGLTFFEKDGQNPNNQNVGVATAVEVFDDFKMIVGFKTGEIKVYNYDISSRKLTEMQEIQGHSDKVNVIRYNKKTHEVLSCSDDHTVLVQKIQE